MGIISSENRKVFAKRTKSFLWRLGGYIAVAWLDCVAMNIGLFDLPAPVVAIMALAIGEVTKYININLPEIRNAKNGTATK